MRFRKSSKPEAKLTRRRKVRLAVERLEDRLAPSASSTPLDLSLSTPTPAGPGFATPDFVAVENPNGVSPADASPPATAYTPQQIIQAYGINSIKFGNVVGNGAGQTIAIVDAYDDPNIVSDLATFDTQFGLPGTNATSIATFFTKSGQNSQTPPTATDSSGGWEEEESLDVEWAHALAPQAKIILVEATSASNSNLYAAVNYAASETGVSVVSMSWGGAEYPGETAPGPYNPITNSGGLDQVFAKYPNVTFFVATGDSGSPAEYPSSSPNAVAVGGTSLTVNGNSTYGGETGWSYLAPLAFEDASNSALGLIFSTQGTWTSNPGGYSGNFVTAPGGSGATATWSDSGLNLSGSSEGIEVSVTWEASLSNATSVTFNIYNSTTLTSRHRVGSVTVDEAQPPVGTATVNSGDNTFYFQDLGVYSFPTDIITVQMVDTSANGNMVADAVGIQYAGAGTGGISQYESQPAFQTGVVTQSTSKRTTPDVSFVADPYTGVAIYDSYAPSGQTPPSWTQIGGTSLSCPCWAALTAIIDQGIVANGGTNLGSSTMLTDLYKLPISDFNEITSGYNGFSDGVGYDLVTGLGSPVAPKLVADMISMAQPPVATVQWIGPTTNDQWSNPLNWFNTGTTTAFASNGKNLGTGGSNNFNGTITVANTAGFAPSGNLYVQTTNGVAVVAYTGISGETFTGCSGGSNTQDLVVGDPVLQSPTTTLQSFSISGNTLTFNSMTGFSPSGPGTVAILNGNVWEQVSYTGVNGNTLMGCTGLQSTFATGDLVSEVTGLVPTSSDIAIFPNDLTPTAMTLIIDLDSSNPTNVDEIEFTANNPTTTTTYNFINSVPTNPGGLVFYQNDPAGAVTVTSAAFSLATATSIPVLSTAGFPTSGTLAIQTTTGLVTAAYTSTDATDFVLKTGQSLSGSVAAGGLVYIELSTLTTGGITLGRGLQSSDSIGVQSTAGFASSGTLQLQSASGTITIVTYSGVTATTFTGISGGTGTFASGTTVTPKNASIYVQNGVSGGVGLTPEMIGVALSQTTTITSPLSIIDDAVLYGLQITGNVSLSDNNYDTSTFILDGNGTTDITGTISGSSALGTGNILKMGFGTDYLGPTTSSGNTFTNAADDDNGDDGVIIVNGILVADSDQAFGVPVAGRPTVRVDWGGAVGIDGGVNYSNPTGNVNFQIAGSGFGNQGALMLADASFAGTITLTGSATIDAADSSISPVKLTGSINAGGYGLTLLGPGTLITPSAIQDAGSITLGSATDPTDFADSWTDSGPILIATSSTSSMTLPFNDIAVNTTLGFPTTGTVSVPQGETTTLDPSSDGEVLNQTTSVSSLSNGENLNAPTNAGNTYTLSAMPRTITVGSGDSTTGFAGSGAVYDYYTGAVFTYTSITSSSFVGCTLFGTGENTINNGDPLYPDSFYASTSGFATLGFITVVPTSGVPQTVAYTGVATINGQPAFTGINDITDGIGTETLSSTGNTVSEISFNVASTTAFTPSRTLNVPIGGSPQSISYTATGSANGTVWSFFQSTGTTGSLTTGTVSQGVTTIGAGSDGQILPQGTIDVVSTDGFLAATPTAPETLLITTNLGPVVVTYTGTTGTSFTGCTGGSSTLSLGAQVVQGSQVNYSGTSSKATDLYPTSGGTGIYPLGAAVTLAVSTPVTNVTVTPGSTWTVNGTVFAGTDTIQGTLSGGGAGITVPAGSTLILSAGSQVQSLPTITVASGGTLIVDSTLLNTTSITVQNGGTLSGSGTIQGGVTLNGGAIVSPGDPGTNTGTLHTGPLNFFSGAILSESITGVHPNETFGVLSVNGLLTLGGSSVIQVNLNGLSSTAPTGTYLYTVVNDSSVSGTFTTLNVLNTGSHTVTVPTPYPSGVVQVQVTSVGSSPAAIVQGTTFVQNTTRTSPAAVNPKTTSPTRRIPAGSTPGPAFHLSASDPVQTLLFLYQSVLDPGSVQGDPGPADSSSAPAAAPGDIDRFFEQFGLMLDDADTGNSPET